MRLVYHKKTSERVVSRLKRKVRIRKTLMGTAERPRMSVYRSNKHIHVQAIDDVTGTTLFSLSTIKMDLKNNNIETAKKVGKEFAQIAKSKGVSEVVFDRNGNLFHGRLKAVADSAREAGLKF